MKSCRGFYWCSQGGLQTCLRLLKEIHTVKHLYTKGLCFCLLHSPSMDRWSCKNAICGEQSAGLTNIQVALAASGTKDQLVAKAKQSLKSNPQMNPK